MEERRSRRSSRSVVLEMVLVGTVASVIGILIGLAIDWFPEQASTQADPIDTLWDVLVICSVPIFVGVTITVLYAARLFRQRPGEEELDGPPIHGNTKLEVVWTTLPALMLIALCTYAYVVLDDIEEAPAASAPKEMVVDVYGEQFAWTFKYNEGVKGQEFGTTQLYLPKDRSVRFEVHSKDVIHDFWVPQFRMKIDAVPGETTGYRVTPNRIGDYPVVCAELCGLGHAYMRQAVHVLEPAKFQAWYDKQLADLKAPPGGGDAADGTDDSAEVEGGGGGETASVDAKALFVDGNDNGAVACGACHQLADAGTPEGGVGPSLDEVLPGQDAATIKSSIVEPQAMITKGFPENVMPGNYGDVLSPAELDALVTYLADVTKK